MNPLLDLLEDYGTYLTPIYISTIGVESDHVEAENLTRTGVEFVREFWNIFNTLRVDEIGFSFNDKSGL